MVKIEVKNGFLIFDNNDHPKFKKAINISKIDSIHANENDLIVYFSTDNNMLFNKDLIGYPLVALDIIMAELENEIKRQRVFAAYPTCSTE